MKKLLGLLVVGIALLCLGLYLLYRKPNQTESKVIAEGTIPVNTQWTSVGTYKGKVTVSLSGKAKLDSTRPENGPDGINITAPDFFTLPGDKVFCALAKHDGFVEKIGPTKEITINGELFLGPNEDPGKRDGKGFNDNNGYWSYKIIQ